MKKIGQCRIFADHNQFYIMDSTADPFQDLPQWTDETSSRGFVANQRVINIGTQAHLNDHWVEIWMSDSTQNHSGYDRVITVDITIQSGTVSIMGLADLPEEVYKVAVPPGTYNIQVLVSNLGVDQLSATQKNQSDEQLSDKEIEARADLERYKIVLIPKKEI